MKCEDCEGTGIKMIEIHPHSRIFRKSESGEKCHYCNGTGEQPEEKQQSASDQIRAAFDTATKRVLMHCHELSEKIDRSDAYFTVKHGFDVILDDIGQGIEFMVKEHKNTQQKEQERIDLVLDTVQSLYDEQKLQIDADQLRIKELDDMLQEETDNADEIASQLFDSGAIVRKLEKKIDIAIDGLNESKELADVGTIQGGDHCNSIGDVCNETINKLKGD